MKRSASATRILFEGRRGREEEREREGKMKSGKRGKDRRGARERGRERGKSGE